MYGCKSRNFGVRPRKFLHQDGRICGITIEHAVSTFLNFRSNKLPHSVGCLLSVPGSGHFDLRLDFETLVVVHPKMVFPPSMDDAA